MQIKLVLHEVLCWKWEFLELGKWFTEKMLACSRRSDSRAQDKNSRRKKNEGRLEGERESPFPRFRGLQLNSLPTYHRALLSERLESAKKTLETPLHHWIGIKMWLTDLHDL